MNLKFLLQPTIDKIREDLRPEVREEVRPEVREEEREKNTRTIKLWLEEQIRAGKISEDVDLPDFGDDGKGKNLSSENGKEGGQLSG